MELKQGVDDVKKGSPLVQAEKAAEFPFVSKLHKLSY